MTATRLKRTARTHRVWLLGAALATAGAALLHVGDSAPPLPLWTPAVTLVGLAVAFALAESFLVHMPIGRHAQAFSVGEVPLIVGLFFAAPWVVAVARLVGVGVALTRMRVAPMKVAFTLGQFLFEISVVALVWSALMGSSQALSPPAWLATILAVVIGDALSGVLVTGAMHLHDGSMRAKDYRDTLASGVVPAVANSALALTVVFVAAADWRALWLPGVVGAMLFLAHQANIVLRRRHDMLQRLNTFTDDVGSHLHVDDVVEEVLGQLRAQVQADHAQLVLFLPGGGVTSWGTGGAALDDMTQTHTTLLLRRGTRHALERSLLEAAGVKDAMVVPLPGEDGPMGALVVADRIGDFETFSDDDLEIMHALANHTAAALRNAQLADQLREQVAENEHSALHDALTDLPNRRMFGQCLDDVPGSVAVMLMDLDGFKDVNDALGHATGDLLLTMVADRLRRGLADALCVARIGGDEFVVAVTTTGDAAALAYADRVRSLLAEPFTIAEMSLSVAASIGVALGDATTDAGELLKRADVAMYDAKGARAGIRLYDAEIDRANPDRLLLPSELREAISNGELTVHYQPKADLTTDRIESVEALARWHHPRRGMVSPAEFIPLAEQTGLIVDLTHQVLRSALAQCRGWRDAGHRISVAVNISPRILHDSRLPERLAAMLDDAGLEPAALTLEITESDLMADPARATDILLRLSSMGITLSVDDLGTGYSSLAYLKRLPVHEVKIDRSFVMGMGTDDDDAAIVEAVVALGQRLGKRVVAEGVEDEQTYRRLAAMGCDVAQGYWLSRPMPAADVLSWLQTRELTLIASS